MTISGEHCDAAVIRLWEPNRLLQMNFEIVNKKTLKRNPTDFGHALTKKSWQKGVLIIQQSEEERVTTLD